MNWKTWSLLVLALVAGAVASYAVKSAFFEDKGAQATVETAEPGPKERLLVANGYLAAGSELNATNVRLELTPEKNVPRDGIFSFSEFAGRKTTRDFKDGEPISLYDVEAIEEASEEENAFVPPGYSVVPIEIGTASKVDGSRNYLKTMKLDKLVSVDSQVDIVAVKEEVGSQTNGLGLQRRHLTSTTIVKGASVFAIDDVNRLGEDGPVRTSILSVLLNAEDLELVRKAADEGKIKIVLNNDDETMFEGGLGDDGLGGLGAQNNFFQLEDNRAMTRTVQQHSNAVEEQTNFNAGFVIADIDDAEPTPVLGRKENVSLTQAVNGSEPEENSVSDFIDDVEETTDVEDLNNVEPIEAESQDEDVADELAPSLNSDFVIGEDDELIEEPVEEQNVLLDDESVIVVDDEKVDPFRKRLPLDGRNEENFEETQEEALPPVNEEEVTESKAESKTTVPTGTVRIQPKKVKDPDSVPAVTPAIKSPFVTKQSSGSRRSRK